MGHKLRVIEINNFDSGEKFRAAKDWGCPIWISMSVKNLICGNFFSLDIYYKNDQFYTSSHCLNQVDSGKINFYIIFIQTLSELQKYGRGGGFFVSSEENKAKMRVEPG
jgi:hypothetical protein